MSELIAGAFRYESLENGTVELREYKGDAESIEVPGMVDGYNVTGIGIRAFMENDLLIIFTLPDSVMNIGYCAFLGCSSLCSITLPKSLTSIGDNAFSMCGNLIITVPRGSYAEEYCKKNNLNFSYPDT